LLHKNFPFLYGELLRLFDFDNEFETLGQDYPPDTPTEELVSVHGKQAEYMRAILVFLDDGIKTNAVGVKVMKESRCSFVVFERAWSNLNWKEFS